MLGDAELEALDAQLGDFSVSSTKHHDILQAVIQKYGKLLENYRILRSDYEEEKESRERYKKLSRERVHNPFVLVLVDGDGYIFNDDLVRANAEGGSNAAQMLNSCIRECLPTVVRNSDQCRIMVRIYANLAGLSKALSKAKLVGPEKRSLAPFAASFTRSQDLFDFIDADDKKEGADFKIREMFRLFAENSQCKHIFFAGCHDTGYLSLLTPYRGKSDRITLVRTGAFSSEYTSLRLGIVDFPTVFRTFSLPTVPTATNNGTKNVLPLQRSQSPIIDHKSAAANTTRVCKYFQTGNCRFGSTCANAHVIHDVRRAALPETNILPWGAIGPTMAAQGSPTLWKPPNFVQPLAMDGAQQRNRDNLTDDLPISAPQTEGMIPVNKDGERLDTVIPKPTPEEWSIYNQRVKQQKPCNNFYMRNQCPIPNCTLDHTPLEPEALHVLTCILKGYPCPRKGGCRSADCYNGHICQKNGCYGKGCRLNYYMHSMDPKVADWVMPTSLPGTDDSSEESPTESLEEIMSSVGGAPV